MNRHVQLLVPLVVLSTGVWAEPYRHPSAAINRVLHAPLPPRASLSPDRATILLQTLVRYPPIADLAQPMLRLAGVRVLPKNRQIHDAPYGSAFDLVRVADGSTRHVALPPKARAGLPRWSADGKQYAFTMTGPKSVELWLGQADSPSVRKVPGIQLNPFFGTALEWMPDQKHLLVHTVPAGQGPPPNVSLPSGPKIQQTSGGKASSTYEVRDVLKGPGDEALFDYYGQTQLALVDAASSQVTRLGKPALIAEAEPSPDGKLLLVETIRRPYSYLTTYERFAHEVDLWSNTGLPYKHIASIPRADSVPVWGVPVGPRDFNWRANAPATLVWTEALDGGDWKTQVPFRDRVMAWKAPFAGQGEQILQTALRFGGFRWSSGGQALFSDYDAIKHWTRTFVVDLDTAKVAPRLLWEHSSDDRYNNPGSPLMRVTPTGQWLLDQEGDSIYLSGAGASPEGDRPFLDRFNLNNRAKERLFGSDKDAYETFVAWTDRSQGQFMTRRETPTAPPNLWIRSLDAKAAARQVTHFQDPTPEVRGITKQLVKYKRADGLDLSFTLYLPPGYKAGTRLPAVVWAYPLDFADAKVAGQVSGSTQKFTLLGWPLQLFFLLDGYAVIDDPSMPVVGDANKIYDTYMEQLIAGAQAAVDKAVDMGVVDRDRIGVTGHSHGGLMTVNLLAHTQLFRAGIARSGAYNRSLTAFGFQNERRTLWEAPEVYLKVSPFFHADQIKLPLLLIHGEADANPGTVPLQSQSLFEAIRGNGGTARLVMLPYESHGYAAMESTEHVLYEMLDWFDRYVKNAPPRPAGP